MEECIGYLGEILILHSNPPRPHPAGYILVLQVMGPVRMEHKFGSLRECWDKRKGIT